MQFGKMGDIFNLPDIHDTLHFERKHDKSQILKTQLIVTRLQKGNKVLTSI